MGRKEKLKQVAIDLFTQKGYKSTSVQEIAKESGITKAAFYKHYDSKDSLLIELVKDDHQRMLEKVYSTQATDSISRINLLKKRIEIELNEIQKNSSVFLMLFNESPQSENHVICDLLAELRMDLIDWHKKCLLDAFSQKASPVIWDLVVMFEGMMKEYLSLLTTHQINVPIEKIASFIAASLEAIVESAQDMDSVLTEKDLFFNGTGEQKTSLRESLFQQIILIEQKVEKLSLHTGKREKLLSSLEAITEECREASPKFFLVEALTDYLKKQQDLVPLVLEAEEKINAIWGYKE